MMAYCNLELMQPGCIGRIIFSEDEAGEEASFYVTDKRTITTEGLPSGVRFSDV